MGDDASAGRLQLMADRAASQGDIAGARALLERAAAEEPGTLGLHLKRAAMARASGEPHAALRALSDALAIAPLDFMALLMRADLLDRTGSPEAGEAYGRAIAQRPAGDLPAPVQAAFDRATARRRHFVEHMDARMAEASRAIEARGSDELRQRLSRFRSNALHETKVFHAEPTHFHYPGLREREFHDRSLFSWLSRLEAATDAIEADFHRVAAAERAELTPYVQYPRDVPLRQWEALNHSKAWTAIHLTQNGRVIEANARHCPSTMALLADLPQPHIPGRSPNAMFSLLAPRTHIPPHHGVTNTRLVCHLPLIVPEMCRFRVGAETRVWTRGEAFVFDDTIEHEAVNDSGELRVVLIFDIWHPDLDSLEQQAIGATMVACGRETGAAL